MFKTIQRTAELLLRHRKRHNISIHRWRNLGHLICQWRISLSITQKEPLVVHNGARIVVVRDNHHMLLLNYLKLIIEPHTLIYYFYCSLCNRRIIHFVGVNPMKFFTSNRVFTTRFSTPPTTT